MFVDLEESCVFHPEGFWYPISPVLMQQTIRRDGDASPEGGPPCVVSPGKLQSPRAGEGSERSVQQPTVPSCEQSPPLQIHQGIPAAVKHSFPCWCLSGVSRCFWAATCSKRQEQGFSPHMNRLPSGRAPWFCRQGDLVVYPVNQYLLSNTAVHSSILPLCIPCDLFSLLSYCHSTSKSMQIHHERHFRKY